MSSLEAHDSLVKAAQRLSVAKLHRERNIAEFGPDTIHGQERVDTAKEAYDAAFKLYTNPFGVNKYHVTG